MSKTPSWKPASTSVLSPTHNKVRSKVKMKMPNIECELLEIHWKSGLDTARNKTKITAPHWKTGDILIEDDKPTMMHFSSGSQKPGLYLIAGKGTYSLDVKIKISKSTVAGTATLHGKLGVLDISGNCPVSDGEHLVALTITNPPVSCAHIEGDAVWLLDVNTEGIKPLKEKSRLEVFFILDRPAVFYSQGAWVEALRLAFKSAGVAGLSDDTKVVGAITKYCHSGHGMKYDTISGGSKFNALPTGGSNFELMKYISRTGSQRNIVNCYDQAAAVQSFSGVLGVNVDWYFLQPYGYILRTNLVGVGQCNNPFFDSNGSKAIEVVGPPIRTGFGNHAFIGLRTKIYDACAGLHIGTETLRQYMKAAIDATSPDLIYNVTSDQYFTHLEGLPNPSSGLSDIV